MFSWMFNFLEFLHSRGHVSLLFLVFLQKTVISELKTQINPTDPGSHITVQDKRDYGFSLTLPDKVKSCNVPFDSSISYYKHHLLSRV